MGGILANHERCNIVGIVDMVYFCYCEEVEMSKRGDRSEMERLDDNVSDTLLIRKASDL